MWNFVIIFWFLFVKIVMLYFICYIKVDVKIWVIYFYLYFLIRFKLGKGVELINDKESKVNKLF